LEHYHAYLRSQQQDERGAYLRLPDRLRLQLGLQKRVSDSKDSTAPGIGRNSANTPISN
jgi:hypothetical protein